MKKSQRAKKMMLLKFLPCVPVDTLERGAESVAENGPLRKGEEKSTEEVGQGKVKGQLEDANYQQIGVKVKFISE